MGKREKLKERILPSYTKNYFINRIINFMCGRKYWFILLYYT